MICQLSCFDFGCFVFVLLYSTYFLFKLALCSQTCYQTCYILVQGGSIVYLIVSIIIDLYVGSHIHCHSNCRITLLQLWYFSCKFISRYPKATEIFEGIARQSINNNLLKYGVRGILLNAGICQLCRGDPVAITNSLERYQVCTILLRS